MFLHSKYKDDKRDVTVTYIYGRTGTGKTRSVMDAMVIVMSIALLIMLIRLILMIVRMLLFLRNFVLLFLLGVC